MLPRVMGLERGSLGSSARLDVHGVIQVLLSCLAGISGRWTATVPLASTNAKRRGGLLDPLGGIAS
jgi:hypothetical protein